MKKNMSLSAAVIAVVSLGLTACDSNFDEFNEGIEEQNEVRRGVLVANADIAFNGYSDALKEAEALKTAVDALVATPTETNLTAAKDAWLTAREPYGQMEAYRFRNGPIDALKDDGTMGEEGDGPEGQINAWPLGEALIDYKASGTADGVDTADSPGIASNIIADSVAVPTIDEAAIVAFNEKNGDEANVATGYHAIEFLLWGQDLNAGQTTWNTPRTANGGQRPATDYDQTAACTKDAEGTTDATGDNCKRRGDYLKVVTQLLIKDLTRLKEQWDPAVTGNYRETFIAGGDKSVSIILESMGRLSFGELAGERMNIALTQDSQEDEHSCFSDNTHRDILLNALGVQNSFLGQYKNTEDYTDAVEVTGTSLHEYAVLKGAKAEADAVKEALEQTATAVEKIDDAAKNNLPFDMQIAGGQAAPVNATEAANVRAAIDALVAQTNAIQALIDKLDLPTGDLKQDTEEAIE